VDLVSQYVQLRKSGGNYQGLCPFHNEKSPSFSVSEDKQVYYCFGCKASGNAITFVQNYQGLTFPETVEYLAKRASIPIPVAEGEPAQRTKTQKEIFFKINGLAEEFYHEELKRLPPGHEVKQYLSKRGLSDEMVEKFRLGYAPNSWTDLTLYLEAKRAPIRESELLGLSKKRGDGKSGHYDLFRHRLMYPIHSPTGECIGFGGRVFTPDQQPKYLNSPDSPIFHKGKVFYGLNHSAKFIRSEDEAIVVEGYMDWLALAHSGIGNVVATLGTALTHDHAKLLKRYSQRVLLLFDGDEAGRSAARRSLPILLNEGLLARGLFLPDQLDPDEFLKERGEAALRSLIQSAPDLFDLVSTEAWLESKGSPTGKIQLMDEFGAILAQITEPRLRRLYRQNLANLLDVNIRLIEQSELGASGPGSGRPSQPQAGRNRGVSSRGTEAVPSGPVLDQRLSPTDSEAPIIDLSKASRPELELLNVILMKEVYLKEALEADVGAALTHPGCIAVFQKIAEVYRQMPSKFDTLPALLADQVRPAETVTRHLSEPYSNLNDEAARRLLQDCIKRVKSNFLRSKSKELVKSLHGAGGNISSEQLEQIMNIQKNRRSLNHES
jgi:DNA primase